MARLIDITTCMTELSYQLGETSVPSQGVEGRKIFLQRSLEDLYKLYPWKFAMVDTTLDLVAGVAQLPNNWMAEGNHKFYYGGKQIVELDYDEAMEQTGQVSPITLYYTSFDGTNYFIHVLGAGDVTIQARYQRTAPDLNSGETTPYPNPKTIALGALRYQRGADNPTADTAQEDAKFEAAAQEDYSAFNRQRPKKRVRTLAEVSGHSTGVF